MGGIFGDFLKVPPQSGSSIAYDPMLQGNVASKAATGSAQAASNGVQAMAEDAEGSGGGLLLLIALGCGFTLFYMLRAAYLSGELDLNDLF